MVFELLGWQFSLLLSYRTDYRTGRSPKNRSKNVTPNFGDAVQRVMERLGSFLSSKGSKRPTKSNVDNFDHNSDLGRLTVPLITLTITRT